MYDMILLQLSIIRNYSSNVHDVLLRAAAYCCVGLPVGKRWARNGLYISYDYRFHRAGMEMLEQYSTAIQLHSSTEHREVLHPYEG